LTGLLKHKGMKAGHVRGERPIALGEVKDPHSVEPSIEALRDEDNWVRLAAVRVLWEIKSRNFGLDYGKWVGLVGKIR